MKPKAKWNGIGVKDIERVYWWSQERDRYIVEVRHTKSSNRALMCIFDHKKGDVLIFKKEVSLTVGEVITPDVPDIVKWEDIANKFLDTVKEEK